MNAEVDESRRTAHARRLSHSASGQKAQRYSRVAQTMVRDYSDISEGASAPAGKTRGKPFMFQNVDPIRRNPHLCGRIGMMHSSGGFSCQPAGTVSNIFRQATSPLLSLRRIETEAPMGATG
ncbi:conserved hypothetical protein [Ruegeria lacuscaerulensis ITI-1157]|nr:conserved hypothetical protein [Ruegeria lacuscaerulensis ITI-1157]